MPPGVVDRRVKARHKKKPVVTPPSPIQLAVLPSLPHPTHLKPPIKAKQILNPSPAALAFDPLGTAEGAAGNALKQIVPGGSAFQQTIPGVPSPGDALKDKLGLPGIANPISTIGDAIGWIIHPQRLVKIVGGGILIIMGLHQLTKAITGATPGRHAHRLMDSVMTAATLVPK